MPNCPECNSTEMETTSSTGLTTCITCGCVVSQTLLTEDIEFSELSSGRCVALGQVVSKHGYTGATGKIGRLVNSREISRERNLQKVKAMAGAVSHKLHIGHQVETMAMEFFQDFSRKKYTHGRKLNHFISVCLYISCRICQTPHMLLDFSELLRTDINGLYRLHLMLTKNEQLKFPVDDASVYCARFAEEMNLGTNMRTVINLSVKIIKAMRVNWISIGRKPAGLCAASLIMACRLEGIKFDYHKISEIIGIRPETVEKRLFEFKDTEFADWTVKQFKDASDLTEQDCLKLTIPQMKPRRSRKVETDFTDISQHVEKIRAELDQLIEEEGVQFDMSRDFPSESPTITEKLTTTEDLGLNETLEELLSFRPLMRKEEESAEKNLEDVDDEEIDEIMNTAEEVKVKTEIWEAEYAEFEIEKQRKREERERIKHDNKIGLNRRRKRRAPAKRNTPISEMNFETAGQAIMEVVKRKKVSLSCIEGLDKFTLPSDVVDKKEEYPELKNAVDVTGEPAWEQKEDVKIDDHDSEEEFSDFLCEYDEF